jgi:hypothetical protein
MIWIHKSLSNKIEYCKYWNDRIIEAKTKINRGYLTMLGAYAPTEGKADLSEQFYEELLKALDKINKNDYLLVAGDLNARI